MLLRDWKCDGCGNIVEDVPMSVTGMDCPICGCAMKKVWPSPSVVFKGPGFTPKFHGRGTPATEEN